MKAERIVPLGPVEVESKIAIEKIDEIIDLEVKKAVMPYDRIIDFAIESAETEIMLHYMKEILKAHCEETLGKSIDTYIKSQKNWKEANSIEELLKVFDKLYNLNILGFHYLSDENNNDKDIQTYMRDNEHIYENFKGYIYYTSNSVDFNMENGALYLKYSHVNTESLEDNIKLAYEITKVMHDHNFIPFVNFFHKQIFLLNFKWELRKSDDNIIRMDEYQILELHIHRI